MTHVVVRIKVNVRNVVRRIAYEDIVSILNNIEVFVIWRVIMRVRSRNVAPVGIAIDIIHRMRSLIMIKRVRVRIMTGRTHGICCGSETAGKADRAE